MYGPATLRISQIPCPASCFLSLLFFFFLNSSILSISLFISFLRDQIVCALSQSHRSLSLSSFLLPSFLSFLLPLSFFLFSLNKYRFRLSELTLVSALYPFLTRIEFRTEDRSLFVAIFSEARDRFFSPSLPFFLSSFFSVERCWPAGPEVRRCVCPKGDFDQTQSIPLNLYAHPRRALRRGKIVQVVLHACKVALVATRLRVEN